MALTITGAQGNVNGTKTAVTSGSGANSTAQSKGEITVFTTDATANRLAIITWTFAGTIRSDGKGGGSTGDVPDVGSVGGPNSNGSSASIAISAKLNSSPMNCGGKCLVGPGTAFNLVYELNGVEANGGAHTLTLDYSIDYNVAYINGL